MVWEGGLRGTTRGTCSVALRAVLWLLHLPICSPSAIGLNVKDRCLQNGRWGTGPCRRGPDDSWSCSDTSSSTYVIRVHSRVHIPHSSVRLSLTDCRLTSPLFTSGSRRTGAAPRVFDVFQLPPSLSVRLPSSSVLLRPPPSSSVLLRPPPSSSALLRPPPLPASSIRIFHLHLPPFSALHPPHPSFANVVRLPPPMFSSPPRSSAFLPRCRIAASNLHSAHD